MSSQSATFTRNRAVVSTEAGDDVFLLHPQHGHCYSFSGPSARLWELLDRVTTAKTAAEILVQEYAIDVEACRTELADHLISLEAEGLVLRVGGD